MGKIKEEHVELIKKRIKNQLRIHWNWLKNKDSYEEISDFINSTINQVINRINDNKKLS